MVALALWLTLGGDYADATRVGASATSGTERSGTAGLANSLVGDVDCSGNLNAVDALKLLRYTIALTVTQTEPCDDPGTGGPPLQGDVDCDADVDLVDSLRVLRYVAGFPVFQNEPCPDIGT